ncbi:MAG: hypothetical protein QME69_09990 [Candidatus Saccharicenans sp.]|nr:hypothetical protein [Candidatus Saccharicenans sp.]
MFFGIASFLLIIAISLRITFGRYLNHLPEEKRQICLENFKSYLRWIAGWKFSFLKLSRWDRAIDYFIKWGKKNYSGWTVWLFYLMSLCYLYLALSGMFFAWFVPRGLFGFPLLLHVAAGALFAITLTVILFLKARYYLPERLKASSGLSSGPGFWCPLLKKSLPRTYIQAVAFWLFALTGFLLAASTLGSMLPYFNYPAQLFFFHIHRWSALVSVLSAILGLEAMIVE